MKFRVTNWAEYDAGLRRRGNLTLCVTDEAIAGWQAAPRPTAGGQSCYSDLAIETGLMLRLAFHLPLRQTEGLMASVFELMGVSLATPDHSTLSRRAMTMTSISKGCRLPTYDTVAARAGDIPVIIPSHVTAVLSATADHHPSQRDQHITLMAAKGRRAVCPANAQRRPLV